MGARRRDSEVGSYSAGRRSLSPVDRATVCRLRLEDGQRLLEIGCGNGIVAAHLLETVSKGSCCPQLFLTDRSFRFLPLARQSLLAAAGSLRNGSGAPRCHLCATSAQELPFRRGSFHSVLAMAVLHHLDGEELEMALASIAEACRPGGQLLLVEDWAFVKADAFESIARRYRFGPAGHSDEYHRSSEEWTRLCEEAGFQLGWGGWMSRPFDPSQKSRSRGPEREALVREMERFPEEERAVRMWIGDFELMGVGD